MRENPDLIALDTIEELPSVPSAPIKVKVDKVKKPNVVDVEPFVDNSVYPPFDDLWARVINDDPQDAEEVFLLSQDIPDFQKITRQECKELWQYIHDRKTWIESNARNNH